MKIIPKLNKSELDLYNLIKDNTKSYGEAIIFYTVDRIEPLRNLYKKGLIIETRKISSLIKYYKTV